MVRILGSIVVVGCWITAALLGIYIYVGSILGAHHVHGYIGAVVTAVLPPFAQIYWLIVNWTASGTITSPYSLACLAWLIAVVIINVVGRVMPDE